MSILRPVSTFRPFQRRWRPASVAEAAVTARLAVEVSWLAGAAARAGLRVSYRTTLDAARGQPASWLADSSLRVSWPIERLLRAAKAGQIAIENLMDVLSGAENPASWAAELTTRGSLPADSLLDVFGLGAVPIENLLSAEQQGQYPIEHLASVVSGQSIPVEWRGAVGVTFIGTVPVSWLASLGVRGHLNISWARQQAGAPARLFVETLGDRASAPRQMPVERLLSSASPARPAISWRLRSRAELVTLPEWRANLQSVSRFEIEVLLESLRIGILSLEELLSTDALRSIPISWLSLSLPDAILIQSITLEPEIGAKIETAPEIEGEIEVAKS